MGESTALRATECSPQETLPFPAVATDAPDVRGVRRHDDAQRELLQSARTAAERAAAQLRLFLSDRQ